MSYSSTDACSNVQLSKLVNLSESACLRRVRALEQAAVIDRYVMIVNQASIGLPENVFVEITLNRSNNRI